jgi:poly-gamma-glutamate capsule biosynthesis protein CapA/YwtB (metallophosphatase superfamily)
MSEFSILGVGDVAAKRRDLGSMFAHIAPILRSEPVVFGQLEAVVSDRGQPAHNAKLAMRSPAALAPVLADSGFTMMSFAGNHCFDWGADAFRDTLDHVRASGVRVAGAGANLIEARAPAIQVHDEVRVALIAASAILPAGYAAGPTKPGCAPIWAHTLYEQIETDQPGTMPRIRSYADPDDLAALLATIRQARAAADIVLLSLHWGIHMVRGTLADYQIEVAEAAIEAGADAILGHHPHLMKGIGFHRGKPIFYSLGNFAIEQPHVFDPAIVETDSFRHIVSLNPHWSLDSSYMLPEETRITGIARLVVRDGAIVETRFRPCWIDDSSVPHPLDTDDFLFARVHDYLATVSRAEGLSTTFRIDGDELVLAPA